MGQQKTLIGNILSVSKINVMGEVSISYNFSQLLKGLACIVIALHHYSQTILDIGLSDNPIFFAFSTQGGYAGVALFFFLSGYGLMESETKAHLNIWQFIKRRIWKIYKAVLIVNTIEYLSIIIWNYFQLGEWEHFEWDNIFGITHQDYFFWFIEVLFTCYAAFFLCTLSKSKRSGLLIFAGLFVTFLWFLKGTSLNHWMSIPLFFIGALVSANKKKTSVAVKHWAVWSGCVLVSILSVLFAYNTTDMMPVHIVFNVLLILVFLFFCSRYEVEIKYTSLLGILSFPIYLVHHKIIDLSLFLGNLAPVWLFLLLTIYFGWLLHKNIQMLSFNKESWGKLKLLIVK